VHDRGRDVLDALAVVEELALVLQEAAVEEVVALDAREGGVKVLSSQWARRRGRA
jgi:hypothetical protein